jgi:ABC-type transporter Mla maintaining outer membrane lipid asymmetry permease subunit MlaE
VGVLCKTPVKRLGKQKFAGHFALQGNAGVGSKISQSFVMSFMTVLLMNKKFTLIISSN